MGNIGESQTNGDALTLAFHDGPPECRSRARQREGRLRTVGNIHVPTPSVTTHTHFCPSHAPAGPPAVALGRAQRVGVLLDCKPRHGVESIRAAAESGKKAPRHSAGQGVGLEHTWTSTRA